jgi:ribosomal protein L40E
MRLTKDLQAERKYVEETLASKVICSRCGAALYTYADECKADLSDLCEGFTQIEDTRLEYQHSKPSEFIKINI